MQNIIELVLGLCIFHSLLSIYESIRDFKPTKTAKMYQGKCLDRKGNVRI